MWLLTHFPRGDSIFYAEKRFGKFARRRHIAILALGTVLLVGLAFLVAAQPTNSETATYYDGVYTASGDYMHSGNPYTCATPLYPGTVTPVYPLGSKLLISDGVRAHTCRVTDTGGMSLDGIDLSYPLGEYFGLTNGQGVAYVSVTYLGRDPGWYYGRQY